MPSSVTSSSSAIVGGIFSSEPGQRLLVILEMLTKRAFQGLYDKCVGKTHDTYYQTGLRRCHVWSDEVLQEDIAHVKARCPDFEETYSSCFASYIYERYRGAAGQRERPTIACPPVLTFVRRYVESIAQQDGLLTGEFFSLKDPVLRRITCMDAGRSALYALVTSESLRVELASEVSATRARAPRSAPSLPPPPPPVVDEEENEENHAEEEEEEEVVVPSPPHRRAESEVRPEDSVSQVGSVHQQVPRYARNDNIPVISTKAQRHEREGRAASVVSQTPSRAPSQTPSRAPSQTPSRAPSHVPPSFPPPSSPPQRSRHDFHVEDDDVVPAQPSSPPRARSPTDTVASLKARSRAGSSTSSVDIGLKRVRSPKN